MHKTFTDWLKSDDCSPYITPCAYGRALVTRVPVTGRIDYLFSQTLYSMDKEIPKMEPMAYSGIWDKETNLLYSPNLDVKSAVPDSLLGPTKEELQKTLESNVRALVESLVADDQGNIGTTELTSCKRDLDYEEKYGARNRARSWFLQHYPEKPDGHYKCFYTPDDWHDETLLAYITDPGAYVENEAKKYIQEKGERILFQFLGNKLLLEEYDKLISPEPDPGLLAIRHIILAMDTIPDAKAVNLTITKDGKLFKCKYEADTLKRTDGSYWTYGIQPADNRRKYKELFGEYTDILSEDIQLITYARKTIYDKNWGNDAYGI